MQKLPDVNLKMYELLQKAKEQGLNEDAAKVIYNSLKNTKTFKLKKNEKRYNITEL